MARTLKVMTRNLGKIAELREKKAELTAQLTKVEAELKELEASQMDDMIKAKTLSLKSDEGTMTVTDKWVPRVIDWSLVDKYIYKNKALELLQRRIAVRAWDERLESGILVPGTEKFKTYSSRWTKTR